MDSWNIQKNLETRKKLSYLEYGIFQEYSKKIKNKRNIENLGVWNIPWNIPWNMKMSEMEYSKKNVNKHKIEIFGIWNIAGILGFSIVI